MKKKFYNRFLMVAMLLATVGSYVSCKDYNEETYADMLGKNSQLEKHVNEQVNVLENQIQILEDAKEVFEDNIETLKNDYVTEIEYAGFVADQKTKHDNLDKKISDINIAIEDAKNALQTNLDDSIIKVQKALNDHITSSKKDMDNLIQDMAGLKGNVADIQTKIKEELEPAIKNLKIDLNGKISNVNTIALDAYKLAERDSIRIDNLDKEYSELKKRLEEMQPCDNSELIARIDSICTELKEAADSANIAYNLAKENLDTAKAYTDQEIEKVIETLRGNTNITLEELEKAYQKADSVLKEELQGQIDSLKINIQNVIDRVTKNEQAIDELTGKFNKVDESLKQFVSGIILQRAENPVFGSFAFPANIQTNVLMAYYGYAGSYGVQFPTFYPRYYVRGAEALSQIDLEMLGVSPETLAQDGDAIVGNAGKVYVTVNPSNVNFEGQTLHIVNSLDEESGIKLDTLKYSDKKLTFGMSTRAAVNGFYEAEAILAPEDINKVKMTFDLNVGEFKETVKDIINPLDGINVSQVANTMFDVISQFNQNLDANALKASWTDSLGVSRNIYSNYNLATTAIKPLSYNFMADANFTAFPGFDKMENVVGSLMDKMADRFTVAIEGMPEFDFNIQNISKIQFDSIDIDTKDINLDLKVTYKDVIKTSVEINIEKYIDIDFKDSIKIEDQTITVDSIPVRGEVKDDNGYIIGTLDTYVSKDIVIPADTIEVHIKKEVPFEWTDTIQVEVPVDIEIPVDASEFKKLLNEIEGIEDQVNELLDGQLGRVNDIIETVNSYLNELGDLTKLSDKIVNIGDKINAEKNNIRDKIISYLDKIEGKLLTAVNSINKAVQPVLLVNTTSGFQVLSQTIYNPTVMSASNVQFIPTSYTAEVIAPAYKKLVGVTNVFSMDRNKSAQNGDADCLSVLKEANAKDGVAEILNGDTQIVNFSAKKGYIYEVTYTSVDFSSFVVAKKYYVTVK